MGGGSFILRSWILAGFRHNTRAHTVRTKASSRPSINPNSSHSGTATWDSLVPNSKSLKDRAWWVSGRQLHLSPKISWTAFLQYPEPSRMDTTSPKWTNLWWSKPQSTSIYRDAQSSPKTWKSPDSTPTIRTTRSKSKIGKKIRITSARKDFWPIWTQTRECKKTFWKAGRSSRSDWAVPF